jgi:hypothetical protein
MNINLTEPNFLENNGVLSVYCVLNYRNEGTSIPSDLYASFCDFHEIELTKVGLRIHSSSLVY